MSNKKINLTVATDINSMGGIASVLQMYQSSGFLDKWNSKLIATHNTDKNTNPYILFLQAILKVCFYMTFKSVGLVHIHMSSRGSFLRKSIIAKLVKALGGKVILHLHGSEFDVFYSKESNEKKQAKIRALFESCDALIVLSKSWKAWCDSILSKSEHVKIIYNAVEQQPINRTKVEIASVVFLGHIGQRKGVKDLINTFKNVVSKVPEAKLYLAGDGEIEAYKELASQLKISDSVTFLGWISGEQKQALLSKADIYCLPSYKEGFPMGVLEAMSLEVPVVSSNSDGIVDAIDNGEEGLLIDAGDTAALAESLIKLIQDRQLNRKLASNAKKKFDENFSSQIICHQLDHLYSELLEK